MFNLVVHQLKRTNPELLPTGMRTVDALRHPFVPSENKRDILDLIWRKAGPEVLLSIGQGIQEIGYDPIWHAAVRSASPAVLFDKWQQFEVFAHSRNRLRIDQTSEKRATFRRYTVDDGTPTNPENLLICGMIIALLEEIGCRGLHCEMPVEDGTAHRIREGGQFFVPDDINALMTAAWTIEWRLFSPRTENAISQSELPEIPLSQSCDATLRTSIETMVRLLMLDVARQWKVGELAREAGLSTRSLQRRLRDAEFSFSQLVRLVRIHEACRLLTDSDIPLTMIGFCAGFSDSAHFSRDFRASMGMTPTDYRVVCQKI
ncbi:MAG: helix-turn-helix transcriptional regulator [Anaerolineae bacterium]|nr:helix-turn-helix transcriptional regulator [Anaerolineae bacterium]